MKRVTLLMAVVLLALAAEGRTENKDTSAQGPPPAIVVLEEITSGEARPTAEFVGTVFYSKSSDVAAEVDGKVESVDMEEGRRVRQGQVLVILGSELLDVDIRQKTALAEEARVELEQSRRDFARMGKLYKEKSIAFTVYDDSQSKVQRLEKRVRALELVLERDRVRKSKMSIRSPFDGVVLKKSVEVGEWVGPGSVVATVATDGEVEVVVDIPEKILGFLQKGQEVSFRAGGRDLRGRLEVVVPAGDVATRTFSIKIRLPNETGLLEGMQARVLLPEAKAIEGLLVSRDAIINQFGRSLVFVAVDGTAKMIPVQVLGYKGLKAGISGPGLAAGMQAVVKGNERLRDGQPLIPAEATAPKK